MRPFGVSLLLAGYDDNGPQLYQVRGPACSPPRGGAARCAAHAHGRYPLLRCPVPPRTCITPHPQVDPSGSYFAWKASAIGKNMNNAKTFLEKRYSEEVRARACVVRVEGEASSGRALLGCRVRRLARSPGLMQAH